MTEVIARASIDPKYTEILSSVDQELAEKLGDSPTMGYCHML